MRGKRRGFDTRPALADMASQIRACRAADGLTLKQLAARSGVAASTIHKVESQQMVPTVGVLLKIAKGLGRRPQELIRDEFASPTAPESATEYGTDRVAAG
ncbi:MAG: helix-turn-helix transcriptional regulator [Myxococcota bacterium]